MTLAPARGRPPSLRAGHAVSSQLHACALQATGHVWRWGSDAYGSLGDPASADRPEPVQFVLR